jgi:hypothetical protein
MFKKKLTALLLPILVGATSSGRSPRRSVDVDFSQGRNRKGGKGISGLSPLPGSLFLMSDIDFCCNSVRNIQLWFADV